MGHTWEESDTGYLLVWAENTGQRLIDRVEIDNRACTDHVWVFAQDDNEQVILDEKVPPGELRVFNQFAGQRWNRSTQNKVSQWFVSVSTSRVAG
jgi:hypothetical protein